MADVSRRAVVAGLVTTAVAVGVGLRSSPLPAFPGYVTAGIKPSDKEVAIWQRVRGGLPPQPRKISEPMVEYYNGNLNRWLEYRLEDKWQSPAETLKLRSGDCKDYATLKYATLLAWGESEDNLAIVIGEIRHMPENEPHAFCCWKSAGQWKVLDNNFPQLIKPEDYINWTPLEYRSGDRMGFYLKEFSFSGHAIS